MKRGYAIPLDGGGNVIKSAEELVPGTEFELKMSDGERNCIVKEAD